MLTRHYLATVRRLLTSFIRIADEQIESGNLDPAALQNRQQDLAALRRVLRLLDVLEESLSENLDAPLEGSAESN